MNIIYLILTHKNPDQLERQVRLLNDGHATFYIHIDLKSDLNLFAGLRQMENVFLIKERVDCIWGDFSTIIATLNLIENTLANHTTGMCILMSGNDYPIKPLHHINAFLDANSYKIFIEIKEPKDIWPSFNERKQYYRVNLSSEREHYSFLKGFNVNTLKHYQKGCISLKQFFQIAFIKRKLHLNMNLYGGSQWWAMNIAHLTKVYHYVQANKKKLYAYFSYSLLPDEYFFHSIIMHFKESGYPCTIEEPITYVNWVRKNCTLPVTFEKGDLQELMGQSSNKLFARKFDIAIDEQILNEIDKYISQ